MSTAEIISALYDMVDDMTQVNGFNFTWDKLYSGDRLFHCRDGKPSLTINVISGENTDDEGAIGSGEYSDTLNVVFRAKVPNPSGSKNSDLEFEQEKQIAKCLDDLKARYDFPYYHPTNSFCLAGGQQITYNSFEVEREQQEGVVTQFRLEAQFTIRYNSQRRLYNG